MAYFHSKTVITCALLALATTTTARRLDESRFAPEDVIFRDVAVIGGGASGCYAAVRVKDAGKSVVVIETKNHLVRSKWFFFFLSSPRIASSLSLFLAGS